jgi:signal transduction histidine kinase
MPTMRLPNLDIAHLRGFIALAETGGFAPAAQALGVSLDDLEEGFAALEASIGQPLLGSDRRGLRLTPEGGRLLDNARRLVILHDEAVRCVVDPATGMSACPSARTSPIEPCESVRIRDMLADAIGCVSEGFVLFDAEGRLVLCNERYRAAYPLLADLLKPGVRFADILRIAVERGAAGGPLDDPTGWIAERLNRHIVNEQPTDHQLAGGRWYRISEHATRAGGVVKILTDITEMKHHEEALAESEARYRRLVETAPYGIVVWDGERVRFANRAAVRIVGTGDPDSLVDVPTVTDDASGGRVPLSRHLPRATGQGGAGQGGAGQGGAGQGGAGQGGAGAGRGDEDADSVSLLEARVMPGDGTVREVDVGVHPLAADGHQTWLLVLDDVTRRRMAERALHQAQKMQAIGQLAGGIAHEFNNMLTAIGGFAMMARRTPNDRARVGQCLTEIVKATERASGLTAELLTFGRAGKQEAAARPVRVATLLDDLGRFLHPVLGERTGLSIDVRCEAATVVIDPALLHQCLVNLAINSRDAMPGGGPIALAVDCVVPDMLFWQRHGELRRGAFVTLSVTDTGSGIDPALLDRIFEPFFTTKEQGEGTGLGLSLVYSTVTRAGGAVEVASEPGHGTVFTLFLPAADVALAVVSEGDSNAGVDGEPEGLSMAVSVLLVEDDEQVRALIRLSLEDMGMRVVCAGDGVAALDAFAARGGAFDLLVTDLVMPRMGGAEMARALRRDNPDLPIIVISGYPPEGEDLDDLLADTGRVAFLHKPVNCDDLAAMIKALVV